MTGAAAIAVLRRLVKAHDELERVRGTIFTHVPELEQLKEARAELDKAMADARLVLEESGSHA